jgi:hypothetical protein
VSSTIPPFNPARMAKHRQTGLSSLTTTAVLSPSRASLPDGFFKASQTSFHGLSVD